MIVCPHENILQLLSSSLGFVTLVWCQVKMAAWLELQLNTMEDGWYDGLAPIDHQLHPIFSF